MRKPNQKALKKQVEEFNSTYAIGCAVDLTLDNGFVFKTKVKEKAILLGGHSAVAWFENVVGCYAISKVNTVK